MNFFEGIGVLLSSEKYMNMLLEGLRLTVLISVFAALLGLILGTIVAMVGISKVNKYTIIPKYKEKKTDKLLEVMNDYARL